MSHQILDFSQNFSRLRVKLKQLIIQNEFHPSSVPLEDIAVVLVSHPQVTFSQAVLEGLAEHGAVLIACDRKSLPVGMYLPLVGHHLATKRLRIQVSASVPLQKRAWQQIVQAKIFAQASVLRTCLSNDFGLEMMSREVKSGDPENREAQAAKRYWSKLFGHIDFRRRPDGNDPVNVRLNFGYGVLRGIVARAICASGFHPSIGLHHHNQYNNYCLADDLMEPFRPIIDHIVYTMTLQGNFAEESLKPDDKSSLIVPLLGRFQIADEFCTLFECVSRMVNSLVRFFSKETTALEIPFLLLPVQNEKPF
ncbi:MAG: type II CRISPR-associated endonuclease Cas1 [Planctomycetaceae bacterium]|nr:type II CRISPR-associated endonuclease Cas1 [Planctomycetaceae bacterium]